MKNEEASQMLFDYMNSNNNYTKVDDEINKRISIKYQCYTYLFLLILIIFIILGIFTDIDTTKRITRTSLLTRARSFMQNCTEGILINPNINVSNVNQMLIHQLKYQ